MSNSPVVISKYFFDYDQNQPILDQVIYSKDETYLLNVRKVYTNNTYFGVEFTCFDKLNGLTHRFRCKDRHYPKCTEESVEDKKIFIEFFNEDNEADSKHFHDAITGLQEIKQDYKLDDYDIYFAYRDNVYRHTIAVCSSSGLSQQGLYSAENQIDYEYKIKEFGYAILNREPSLDDLYFLLNQAKTAKANYVHTVSTAYSNIIVERDFQYNNDELSEIKNGKKTKNQHFRTA